MIWGAVLAAGAMLAVAIWRNRHLWQDVVEEGREAWYEARDEFDAARLLARYRRLARPALLLEPSPGRRAVDAAARLGGPVWLADGEHWPVGSDGLRLEFVAQIDFAALTPLEGFPREGVARFFVGRDPLWGANWDRPDRSGVRVLWHDGAGSAGRQELPHELTDDEYSPFGDTLARTVGVALTPRAIVDPPDSEAWQVRQLLDDLPDDARDAAEDRLFELAESHLQAHRVGGHPSFTQPDFRAPGKFDEFDVLLLGLTSDDTLAWGDVGEAMFLIRSEDLARRDFARVAFYWDCH